MVKGKIIRPKFRLSWEDAVGYMLLGAEIGFLIGKWLDARELVKSKNREVA
jgi:hypothetical protein